MSLQRTTMLLALAAGFATARIGVGSCPSVTPISNGFKTGGQIADGQYHLMRFDNQFKWGWESFAKLAGETLNCQSAQVTKNTNGFSWTQTKPVDAFRYWPTQVDCDASGNCGSYFPGKPLMPIYYDAAEPTMVIYQCFDLKYAADFFIQEMNPGAFWAGLIKMTYGVIGQIHYSLMLVAYQNPTTYSDAAKTRVENFIKTFSDVATGYKSNLFVSSTAYLFGWDGKGIYNLKDQSVLDQSQATCKW